MINRDRLVTRLHPSASLIPVVDVIEMWQQGSLRWAHVLDYLSLALGRRVTEEEAVEWCARGWGP